MPIVKCDYCKQEIWKSNYYLKRSKNLFCSIQCKSNFQKEQNTIILKETHAELIINSPKYGIKTILIDLDDVDKIKNIGKWHIRFCSHVKNFYVESHERDNYKNRKIIKLHRYITNCPKNLVVDHINHNTLDNRKCNLKVCTIAENNQNNLNVIKLKNKKRNKSE